MNFSGWALVLNRINAGIPDEIHPITRNEGMKGYNFIKIYNFIMKNSQKKSGLSRNLGLRDVLDQVGAQACLLLDLACHLVHIQAG